MNNVNLLRTAVENRKKYLIEMLKENRATSDPGSLNRWTLSELENEWKRYQKWQKRNIG
ncbi:Fur-regulated basic protein FbpA [Sporolactobacillus sp. KGMB 08714]|uniref:Fur-regulated basic protein FbpA n=1 Tax=Sporolactobacillus sp. KGMB 08714 TaxID=3064704 RepID=UPI002FBDF319